MWIPEMPGGPEGPGTSCRWQEGSQQLWQADDMILEHAILSVRSGFEVEFEAAFEQARPLISGQPGFESLSLSRSQEFPSQYLLLVGWVSVEAHTEGFRKSPEYESWRELLHHFYDPFPVVEHFAEVG